MEIKIFSNVIFFISFYIHLLKYSTNCENMNDLSRENLLLKITNFLDEIGIKYRFTAINEDTFLPGLKIDKGELLIDENKLKYVGDILHEAGHIALLPPEIRNDLSGSLENQPEPEGTEMAVIAWTYAACKAIPIPTAIVIHNEGYKGTAESIIKNFDEGHYFGVPILQWLGMTNEKKSILKSDQLVFPKMSFWVRK